MDFCTNGIGAGAQQFVGNRQCGGVGLAALVGGGIGVVGRSAFGHVVAGELGSVDIDDHAVIDIVGEAEDIVLGGGCVELEGLAEIIGGTLVGAVAAVVQFGGVVSGAGLYSNGSVAEGSLTFLPVGDVGHAGVPVFIVERALVVVAPRVVEGNE